jgi:hypothetical protein
MSRGLPAALAVLSLPGLAGCAQVIDHRPDTGLVDRLGREEAGKALGLALSRAAVPRVFRVTVTDDLYRYDWQETLHGPYGIPVGALPRTTECYFLNIERVEVYANHYVFVWFPGGHVDKVLFEKREDATHFADLVMSFRAYRLLRQKE